MTLSLRLATLALLLLLPALFGTQHLSAQMTILPQLGLQTMWFNGDYPVRQPISPGSDRTLPLGGGVIGNTNAVHGQIELIPSPESIFRIPVIAEAYFMNGKTTFAFSSSRDPNPKRWLFQHSGTMFSLGTGLTINPLKNRNFYLSFEGRVNHIPSTELVSRVYFTNTGEVIDEQIFEPDTIAHTRIGAYIKAGVQVEFFEPFLIDFSVGYGAINLLGKETDPARARNLFVVDNRNSPELTLGYIGFGLSVIFKSPTPEKAEKKPAQR